jgi:hypothetical protein
MNNLLVVWVCIVVGAVAAGVMAATLGAVQLQDVTPDKVGTVLTSLMFVALLIERAVEVFVSPITADEKQNLVSEQAQLRATVVDLKARLVPPPTTANPTPQLPDAVQAATIQTAIDTLQLADKDLATRINVVDKKTQKIALSFSVPISFVVALGGVRSFAPFIGHTTPAASATASASATQLALFTAADVVLTAGLLAGGADGIHKILDRFIKLAAGKDVQQPANK